MLPSLKVRYPYIKHAVHVRLYIFKLPHKALLSELDKVIGTAKQKIFSACYSCRMSTEYTSIVFPTNLRKPDEMNKKSINWNG